MFQGLCNPNISLRDVLSHSWKDLRGQGFAYAFTQIDLPRLLDNIQMEVRSGQDACTLVAFIHSHSYTPDHTTSHMGFCFFCSLTTLLVILKKVGNTILSTNIHDVVLITTRS